MHLFENQAGLSISTEKLQVVDLEFKNNRFELVNVAEAFFSEPIDFEKDKETKISALLQGAYDEIQLTKTIESNSISVALPLNLFKIVHLPYDNTLLHEDLIREFKWELSVLYPFITTEDLVIQYIEVDKNNIINYNSVLVYAISRKYLRIVDNFCKNNSLKLKFIDNSHVAAQRALTISKQFDYSGINLSIYYGCKFLSILLMIGVKPIYTKLIPVTNAGDIPEIIEREFGNDNFAFIKRNMINEAFICGDELTDLSVKKLSETTGLNFILFNPFERIKINPQLYNNRCFTEKFNSFASSAGIAYRVA